MSRNIAAIVLAAGKGTRMKSELPKLLHTVAGVPILSMVVNAWKKAGVENICTVVSQDWEPLRSAAETSGPANINFCIQETARGTGDAVASAAFSFRDVIPPSFAKGKLLLGDPFQADYILVSPGDTPALDPTELRRFIEKSIASGADTSVLGMDVPNSFGYGRLVTDADGKLLKIVEQKDATKEESAIRLCNSGVIFAKSSALFRLLDEIDCRNAQSEFYLTDIFARTDTSKVEIADDYRCFAGINNRKQLAEVEGFLIQRKIDELMLGGATFRLPQTNYVEWGVTVGPDSVIGPNVSLRGQTKVAQKCRIGSGCDIRNVIVGDNASIGSGSILHDCVVGSGETLAPLSQRG